MPVVGPDALATALARGRASASEITESELEEMFAPSSSQDAALFSASSSVIAAPMPRPPLPFVASTFRPPASVVVSRPPAAWSAAPSIPFVPPGCASTEPDDCVSFFVSSERAFSVTAPVTTTVPASTASASDW